MNTQYSRPCVGIPSSVERHLLIRKALDGRCPLARWQKLVDQFDLQKNGAKQWDASALDANSRDGLPVAMLPNDFPNWKSVYTVYWRFRQAGVWVAIHNSLRESVRKQAGRTSSAAIIDSQSVKTTEVGGDERGYDAGKKTAGRKRHIAVDTLGLVLAVVVHSAAIQDCAGARFVFMTPHAKTAEASGNLV